jgi:acyl-CoA thioester hydrolase
MRWADLDLLGHVNNVTYVDYLQEARVDVLRVHAPDARAADLAEGVVVVRHEVSYLEPLLFRFEPVCIDTWVTEIRAASFTMAYEVFVEDDGRRTVFARARTVLTPYVFEREAPRRLSTQEREALARLLEPDPAGPRERLTSTRVEEGRYPVQVRFSDVDVYGHVNNVKYVEFFQEGRIRLLSRLSGSAAAAPPAPVVLARTEVDYVRPLLFRPEPYMEWSRVGRVGRTSAVVEAEICDGDDVFARSRSVLVFVDPATQRSTEPPAALRAALEASATRSAPRTS